MDRNRRKLLKLIGATSATSVGTIGTSGVAGASSSSSSDTTYPEIPDIDEDNWEEAMEEVNQQYYTGSSSSFSIGTQRVAIPAEPPTIPDPPFNTCITLPNGESLCLRTLVEKYPGYIECADREILKVSMDVAKKKITWRGDVNLQWTTKIWVGVDENLCLWVGINSAEQEMCSKVYCNLPPVAETVNDFPLVDLVADILDVLDDNSDKIVAGTAAGVTLSAAGGGGGFLSWKMAKGLTQ